MNYIHMTIHGYRPPGSTCAVPWAPFTASVRTSPVERLLLEAGVISVVDLEAAYRDDILAGRFIHFGLALHEETA